MTTIPKSPVVVMTLEDQIASMKEDNTKLIEANFALKQENEALKTENKALNAKVAEMLAAVEAKDNLEIVAVPAKGIAKVPDLYCDGGRCERKEADGYSHFIVPRQLAETLLTNTQGMKYLLVGQKEPLKAKRRNGLAVEEVTVYPHVLGEAGWKQADVK
jgi:regulator of replication initiation timing